MYQCFLPKFSLVLVGNVSGVESGKKYEGQQEKILQIINSKRKIKENMGPLLNGAGATVTEDTEEPEVLNAFFASVFTGKPDFQKYQIPDTRGRVWSKDYLPSVRIRRIRLGNT